jgi:hypothetical protein
MKPCSSSPSILFPFSISMDERDENLGNGLGDSSGEAGGDAVSGDAGDAGDEVWRGLATEGVDNNKLGGNSVGVVGVVMLGAVFIKNMY